MFERPKEEKITMKEVREKGIKMRAKWLAEIDEDIVKHFKSSGDDLEVLEKTDFATNTGERNNRLFRLVKKEEAAQKLFDKRKETLAELLKEVGQYTGKDMGLLKEQLGMGKVADDEISTEISPEKRPTSAGEME